MPIDQLTILQAFILGIVEGITEYLPISSTGHLILVSALLGLNDPAEKKAAVDAFNIVIQGGAILAVLGLYWRRVRQMIFGLLGRDAPGLKLLLNLIIAFLPAAVIGVLIDDWIESRLFFPIPVTAALALGGVLMIAIGPWQRRRFHGNGHADPADSFSFVDIEHLTWKRALVIGLMQCIAMWPGTSRSMITIVGGMFIGLRPRQAAEFSFLLGLPTLGGACVYKGAKNLLSDGPNMFEQLGAMSIIIGIIVAMLSAALAIKWLVGYLNKHGLAVFGWYRLVLAAVIGILVFGTGTLEIRPTTPAEPDRPNPEEIMQVRFTCELEAGGPQGGVRIELTEEETRRAQDVLVWVAAQLQEGYIDARGGYTIASTHLFVFTQLSDDSATPLAYFLEYYPVEHLVGLYRLGTVAAPDDVCEELDKVIRSALQRAEVPEQPR